MTMSIIERRLRGRARPGRCRAGPSAVRPCGFDAVGGFDLPAAVAKLCALALEDSRLRIVAETATAGSCDPARLADAIGRWADAGG